MNYKPSQAMMETATFQVVPDPSEAFARFTEVNKALQDRIGFLRKKGLRAAAIVYLPIGKSDWKDYRVKTKLLTSNGHCFVDESWSEFPSDELVTKAIMVAS